MFLWPCIMNWPYKTTNVMHWILFIRQILLLSSTCFEYQVLIFMYNYVLLKMSTWYSKHVEESNNIWRINNIQCITLVVLYGQNSTCFGHLLCPSSAVFHCTFGTGKFHAGFRRPLPNRVRMELSSILTLPGSGHQKPVWNLPVPNVQWKTPDDGQRGCPKKCRVL